MTQKPERATGDAAIPAAPIADSGLVTFEYAYSFADGGRVEEGRNIPGEPERLVPFEVARWRIEPGTGNDLDVHRSYEMWLVADGAGKHSPRGVRVNGRGRVAVAAVSGDELPRAACRLGARPGLGRSSGS
jgi:hypothetical protein